MKIEIPIFMRDHLRRIAAANRTTVENWVLSTVKKGVVDGLCDIGKREQEKAKEEKQRADAERGYREHLRPRLVARLGEDAVAAAEEQERRLGQGNLFDTSGAIGERSKRPPG